MSELPYEIDAKYDLFAVLESPHEIPYHSRPFMWTRENYIEHIVRQAIDKYRDGKQHWLGFLIVYFGGPLPSITDAQHRLTVYFLIVLVCARILGHEKHQLSRISKHGHEGYFSSITESDAAILEKYGWQHIPNIRSVYTHDFEALGNVLNGIYLTDSSASRIYDAYNTVYDLLSNPSVLPVEDIGPFLSHIIKTTKVSRVRITDWEFTLEVFDVLNNIKVTVPPIYLLKNTFVRQGGKATSEAIHTAFQRWEQTIGRGAAFDQFVHVMTNLFVGSWSKQDKYVHALTNYLADKKCGFSAFNDFLERGLAARAWMQRDRCSAMISALAAGHEVIDFCVLPLLTLADSPAQVVPFLQRLLAYGLRLPGRFSFNQLARCELLIGKDGVITALAAGRVTLKDAIKTLDQLLLGWLGEETDFAARVASESYKSGMAFNKARIALLYIAEMTDKHEATLDHALIDIDHVSPKNPRKGDPPLQNGELLHCIGNFTPFIGKNSATLRGNRGFGNKPYTEKRDSYAASNIAMTRAIASRYATFADAEIQERSRELATQLDELTKKALFNNTL